MPSLTNKLHENRKNIQETIAFHVQEIFAKRYPQKLKKWRGRKIVPIYEWGLLRRKGIDKIFDVIPEESTGDLPKFIHLDQYHTKKLQVWYRDFNDYLDCIGATTSESADPVTPAGDKPI